MKKIILSTVVLFGAMSLSFGQTARVQVIHNSADPSVAVVDIWAGTDLLIDDFSFRTATKFIDVAAGVPIEFRVAEATSTASTDAQLPPATLTFTAGETYVVVADGLVSLAGFDPSAVTVPFNLRLVNYGREEAMVAGETDVLVYHGSTDAPAVDIEAVGVGTPITGIEWSEFHTSYLNLPTNDYTLNVNASGAVVKSYQAPLSALNLQDSAIVVIASGFLDPTVNSDGAAFGLFVALPEGGALIELPESKARIQIIHNAAEVEAEKVDVYLNDVLLADDFTFRHATAFIDIPAEVSNEIKIAPSTSTDATAPIATIPATFDANGTYIAIANGQTGSAGYNPQTPFSLDISAIGRENALNPGETDFLVFHGATDAPAVNIDAIIDGLGGGTVITGITYGNYHTSYLEVIPFDYTLNVTTLGGEVLRSYQAPFETWNLEDSALVVVASGFLDPLVNSDGADFGLFAALPEGGVLIELPQSTAKVQIIHNAAEIASEKVDVYLNDVLIKNDFTFRTALPFLDVPAEVANEIKIAPSTSTDASAPLVTIPVTFESSGTYIAIANGQTNSVGYTPPTPFTLDIFASGRDTADILGNTDVLVFHGSTDAPAVNIDVTGGANLISGITYGNYHTNYLELANADYQLNVTAGGNVVGSYKAPLAALNLIDSAIVVVASGFLDTAANQGGANFGLWAALAQGGALIELPPATARVQIVHNSADLANENVDIYLDGNLLVDDFAFRTSTAFVDITSEVAHEIVVAPSTSTDIGNAFATVPVTFTTDERYIATANGQRATSTGYLPVQPFSLDVFNMGREASANTGETDILVFHGATDAPAVKVVERFSGTELIPTIAYGNYDAAYLELENADYTLNVTTLADDLVKSYQAPIASLNLTDRAVTIFASGFLDPTTNSDGADFGLWMSLSAGGPLIELKESTAKVQVIHNSADVSAEKVDIYAGEELVANDLSFRNASNFLNIISERDQIIGIAPSNSTSVADTIKAVSLLLTTNEKYIIIANGQVSGSGYSPAVPFSMDFFDMGRLKANSPGFTDVLVFHGSTDAPTVDVGSFVNDISYGEFNGYTALASSDYFIEVKDMPGTSVLYSYSAPFVTLDLVDSALVVLASGFVDPSTNSNGASFGLWAALPAGGELIELPAGYASISNKTNTFSVFPNPTNDFIKIKGIVSNAAVQIINIAGEIVLNTTINPNEAINTNTLASGLYYMVVTENEVQQQIKFVLQ